ncbi:hypothetical protein [Fodinicola feengrottensis]|uniref:Uncharacterized protein n=1 Tax=Fodinicola feengrottensis TaxID=435914 RepID=A0ABP4TC58_9ACTN|nr:hypothetical protein [Fodinicola feengrottensis]
MDWRYATGSPRKASMSPFPYEDDRICYFILTPDGPMFARDDSRAGLEFLAMQAAECRVTLYAVWPGRRASDLFIIDDPGLLLKALDIDDQHPLWGEAKKARFSSEYERD